MLAMTDLQWAAGFLEGEGCFNLLSKDQPNITASQMTVQPLEKLRNIFGATTFRQSKLISRGSKTGIYVWQLSCRRGAAVMMTLYPLMSPRRQEQIRKVLAAWRSHPASKRPSGYRGPLPVGVN